MQRQTETAQERIVEQGQAIVAVEQTHIEQASYETVGDDAAEDEVAKREARAAYKAFELQLEKVNGDG